MSEPVAKRQPIDLEEFDRRLRAPGAQRQNVDEDPLAELARLVSSSPDPFAPLFAAGRPAARAGQPPAAAHSAPSAPAHGLRSGYDGDAEDWDEDAGQAHPDERAMQAGWDAYAVEAKADARRSRAAVLMTSAALIAVFVGIGAVLAIRGRMVRLGSPPTILADAKPFKVKPPSQPAMDQIENATTLLDKGGADAMRPAHIVNTEEQPVDLALAASPKNGAAAANGDADANASAFPAPRMVKTISVRPDGSIISQDGAAGPSSADAAAAPSNGATSASPPASPAAVEPPAGAAGGAEGAASGDAAAAPAEAQAPSFANVVDQAAADSQASAPSVADEAAPSGPAPAPVRAARSAPVRSADLSEDAAPARAAAMAASPAGGWAVQLAAPGTEREAHAEIIRLQRKFAAELAGRRLVSYSARSNGRAVWRVRAAGLSRDAATTLCSRIKGSGGACFMARN